MYICVCFAFSLSEERVLASPSECNAVVRAMMECLQYVISQSITDRDLMAVLIQEQVSSFTNG